MTDSFKRIYDSCKPERVALCDPDEVVRKSGHSIEGSLKDGKSLANAVRNKSDPLCQLACKEFDDKYRSRADNTLRAVTDALRNHNAYSDADFAEAVLTGIEDNWGPLR
jgi:hypothetical protein